MTETLAVVLSGVVAVLLVLLVMSRLAAGDERARADAAAWDADWWKGWAKDREEEADTWRKKALELEDQIRGAERKQLREGFETVVQSEKKTLTVERAAREIVRLYDEALRDRAGIGLYPGSYVQYVCNLLGETTKAVNRERMEYLVDFLVEKARKAEAAENGEAKTA